MAWTKIHIPDSGNPPCKDCPDRHMGCHSECEKYITYRKEQDERRERINFERRIQHQSWEQFHESRQNYIKKNGSLRNPHGRDH